MDSKFKLTYEFTKNKLSLFTSLHLHSFTSPFFYSFYSEKAKYYHIHVLTDILFKIHDSKKAKNGLSI